MTVTSVVGLFKVSNVYAISTSGLATCQVPGVRA
jgi:hypothetical protein